MQIPYNKFKVGDRVKIKGVLTEDEFEQWLIKNNEFNFMKLPNSSNMPITVIDLITVDNGKRFSYRIKIEGALKLGRQEIHNQTIEKWVIANEIELDLEWLREKRIDEVLS